MAAGAVSLRKSHDIVILSFCNIVKGQAYCLRLENEPEKILNLRLARTWQVFKFCTPIHIQKLCNQLVPIVQYSGVPFTIFETVSSF